MEKINVIVPILNEALFLEHYKKLLQVLKKYETNELLFEVFFMASTVFNKPKNYKNLQNSKLILTNLSSKNDLIEKGFAEITSGASLILELNDQSFENILEKMLNERTNSNIIRVYKKQEKPNKIKQFLNKIALTIYEFYLKLFSLDKDLLCENTFQYFNENATQVIKNTPQKNAYLRNYDALFGYEQKKLEIDIKKECIFNKKDFLVIISMISAIFGELLILTTLILTSSILSLSSGFIIYLFLLSGSFFLSFLGYYSLAKLVIKKRANL